MTKLQRDHAPPGKVRIIGGQLRGSKLLVPNLPGLRPTPERLRQTLFDWLAPMIAGARVLDVFAGTGVLGIEALSRGAAEAEFFERDAARAEGIAADLARLRQTTGTVRGGDALQRLAAPPARPFDLVFLDPPFAAAAWTAAAGLLAAQGWLAAVAWVYVETPRAQPWTAPTDWQLHRQREVGDVRGALFRIGAAAG